MAVAHLGDEEFTQSPGLALFTLLAYIGIVAVVGAVTFQHRDIAAPT